MLHKIQNDQVKQDEMGRACSAYGEEESKQDFGGKARRIETTRRTKKYVEG
jgi:hypothetical protein